MSMEKDFDSWNIQKKNIDRTETVPQFNEREIWFVKLGLNVGFEEDGKGNECMRPVVVLRNLIKKSFMVSLLLLLLKIIINSISYLKIII